MYTLDSTASTISGTGCGDGQDAQILRETAGCSRPSHRTVEQQDRRQRSQIQAVPQHRDPAAVLDHLNHEFAEINATTWARDWAIRLASDTHAFPGCGSPADIVTWIQTDASYDQIDLAMIALLRKAQDGEHIAGHIIIQAVRGSVVNAAVRAHAHFEWRRRPFSEFLHSAVAATWTVIATYPVQRRPGAVIKNLTLDALNLTLKFETADAASRELPQPPSSMTHLFTDQAASQQRAEDEVIEMLRFAVQHGHLTPQEATLLARLGFAEDRTGEARRIAEEYGLSYAAVRQRHSRITRRLGAALAA